MCNRINEINTHHFKVIVRIFHSSLERRYHSFEKSKQLSYIFDMKYQEILVKVGQCPNAFQYNSKNVAEPLHHPAFQVPMRCYIC